METQVQNERTRGRCFLKLVRGQAAVEFALVVPVLVVLLMIVVIAAGMSIQLAKGYTHLEPLQYFEQVFGLRMIDYWLLCVLAITVQTLVNNKYMGHFVMVLYYLASAFMGQLGLEHHLYRA